MVCCETSKDAEAPTSMEREEFAQKAMGNSGRWQFTIIVLLSALNIPSAWHYLGFVFLAAPVAFHCTNSSQACVTEQGGPCSSWQYDRSVFSETIITEWDLVCERDQMVNVAQTVFMTGILVSNLLLSKISDRFGRKLPLVASGIMQMVFGASASFSPWFSLFLVLRFLQAVATGSTIVIAVVLSLEILNGKWRTRVTSLSFLPFSFGQEIMVVMAYYTHHWRHFQLAISLPSVVIIAYLWFVPESPRWLLAAGRDEEAMAILRKAAAVNKNQIPANVLFVDSEGQHLKKMEKKGNFLDLLRTPNLRKKTLVICFNWMVSGLCYYGLAQYSSTFSGNIFINVAIAASFILPGLLVSLYTLDKFGRKATLFGGQIITSASCLLVTFCSEAPGETNWIRIGLAGLGISGVVISFVTVYLYSGELFPTVVRNVGVGSGSMCSRVGGLIAPFIASLNKYNVILPPLIFSLISLVAAIMSLLLPETRHTQLPHSLEAAEEFGRTPYLQTKRYSLDEIRNGATKTNQRN